MRSRSTLSVLAGALAVLATLSEASAKPPAPTADEKTEPERSVEALMTSFENEPPVHAVQAAALRHADLDASGDGHWAARARWSNLFPEVQGEIAWLDQRDETFRYSEDIEAGDGGRLKRDSAENRFYEDTRFRRAYSIEAEIDLGGLVFERDELSASRERRKRELARRKLVARVTDLYFDRRKKQILRLADPPTDWRKRLDLVLEIDRLTARIDGLTGGWFREQLDDTPTEEDSDA